MCEEEVTNGGKVIFLDTQDVGEHGGFVSVALIFYHHGYSVWDGARTNHFPPGTHFWFSSVSSRYAGDKEQERTSFWLDAAEFDANATGRAIRYAVDAMNLMIRGLEASINALSPAELEAASEDIPF